MVGLITVDVGDTLGHFSDPRVANILFDLSGIPNSNGCKSWIVGEAERTFLHTTPDLTDKVVDDICGALIIDRSMWPDPWPSGGFNPFPYTNGALAELRSIAPESR
jgi:hypothetical protein